MKKNQTYKFSQESIDRLDRLAKLEGTSKAFILETALKDFEDNLNDERKAFMDMWKFLNTNIEQLELKRDYHPETGEERDMYDESQPNYLSDDENQVLDFYHAIWNEFRKQPFFSEVLPPELDS